MEHYNYGLRAEDRVAAAYARRKHATGYYERSRGAADITAVRGGRRLHIQVRSVRSSTARIMDVDRAFELISKRTADHELARLLAHAKRSGGQPAVALANGDYFWTWRIGRTRDGYEFKLLHHGWLPRLPLERESA